MTLVVDKITSFLLGVNSAPAVGELKHNMKNIGNITFPVKLAVFSGRESNIGEISSILQGIDIIDLNNPDYSNIFNIQGMARQSVIFYGSNVKAWYGGAVDYLNSGALSGTGNKSFWEDALKNYLPSQLQHAKYVYLVDATLTSYISTATDSPSLIGRGGDGYGGYNGNVYNLSLSGTCNNKSCKMIVSGNGNGGNGNGDDGNGNDDNGDDNGDNGNGNGDNGNGNGDDDGNGEGGFFKTYWGPLPAWAWLLIILFSVILLIIIIVVIVRHKKTSPNKNEIDFVSKERQI